MREAGLGLGKRSRAWRWMAAAAVSLALAVGPAMPAAFAAEASAGQPAGGAIAGTDVQVSGDRAVWVHSGANGEVEIRTRNLQSGAELTVAAGTKRKQGPAVSGEWVVWADKNVHEDSSVYWDIIGYNLSTRQRLVLNADKGQHVNPSIDGNDAVWFDMAGSGTLHHYDLAEKRARPLGQGRYPVVRGGLVVYKNPRDGGISQIELSTNRKTELYLGGAGQYVSWFDFNGRYVLWKQGNPQGESKMVLLDTTAVNPEPRDLTVYSVKSTEYGYMELGNSQGVWLEQVGGVPVIKAVTLETAEVYRVVDASGGSHVLGLTEGKLLLAQADGTILYQEVKPASTDPGNPGSLGGGSSGGSGQTDDAKMTVGVGGGKLSTAGGDATLTIPAGALAEDTLLELAAADGQAEAARRAADLGRKPVSGIWEVRTERQFAKKAVLSLALLAAGLDQDALQRTAIYRYDHASGKWKYEGGAADATGTRFEADIAGAGYYAVLVNGTPFGDTAGHWARKEIEWLAMRSLADGMADGVYEPEGRLTRAQFVKLLADAVGIQAASEPSGLFRDVPDSHWARPWIEAAAKAGLAEGTSAGEFQPDRDLTREEMMALLVRSFGPGAREAQALLPEEAHQLLGGFSDEAAIQAWAVPYAAIAVKYGLVEGDDTGLNPAGRSTRAQSAAVVYRYLQALETGKLQ